MAPKKKGSNNGYYSLVMDLARHMDRKRAEEEAQRLWPNMSAAERAPYNMRAKKSNGSAPKMTAVNENMEFVQNHQQEERLREQKIQEDIKKYIVSLANNDNLKREFFHIVHFNNFFITTNNEYYPAEFAITRFNFANGVLDDHVFDMKVKPGKFPIGYNGSAKRVADETHQLSYMDAQISCNLDVVIQSLFEFLSESAEIAGNPEVLPPIFVKDDFKKLTFDILQQLCNAYEYDFDRLKICNLSYLMFVVHSTISDASMWISTTQCIQQLDKDAYDHTPEIPCDFHKEVECSVHCSRSHVVRMAYIVCDSCCPDLGIPLVPGRHVPLESHVRRARVVSSSYADSDASSIRSGNYTNSIAPSFRSNVNSLDFDDNSTVAGDDDGWNYVAPHRGVGRPSNNSQSGWETRSISSATTARNANVREPRTDWRQTGYGNRGRGRGRGIGSFI